MSPVHLLWLFIYHCSLPHSSFGKLGNLDRAPVCPARCIRWFRWWRLDQSLQVAIYLFIFIWKQNWRGRQINDRQQIEIFIYWFNGQRWIGPKPGAKNFFQVSHVSARTQAIWLSSTVFPDCYWELDWNWCPCVIPAPEVAALSTTP